jgi:hypothetical protein
LGLYMKPIGDNKPEGTLIDKSKQFSMVKDKASSKVELPEIVKQINARNENVKRLTCENMDLRVWQDGHRFKLSGKLHYEKPKRFRMEINSILGKEADIGSNDILFWYWSRRDKKPGVHYATHEDLSKTRLKTPFNPMFLRATLGVEVLPSENCRVVENQNGFMLVYPRENASGEQILFSVFVSKSKNAVEGYLVSDQSGKTLAACEVQQFAGDLPSKILYSWYEENRVMLMQLNELKVNSNISESVWSMPNYTPKNNMADGF